jgi:hypothetical protein
LQIIIWIPDIPIAEKIRSSLYHISEVIETGTSKTGRQKSINLASNTKERMGKVRMFDPTNMLTLEFQYTNTLGLASSLC